MRRDAWGFRGLRKGAVWGTPARAGYPCHIDRDAPDALPEPSCAVRRLGISRALPRRERPGARAHLSAEPAAYAGFAMPAALASQHRSTPFMDRSHKENTMLSFASRHTAASPADTPRASRVLHAARWQSSITRPQTFAAWLLIACTILLAGPAFAADWYASPSGAGTKDCMSAANACVGIQAAIDKAAADDTVHVGAGNYAFASDRIRIEKEGLQLIGDNTPFAKPYGSAAGEIVPGTPDNKASTASVLTAPTKPAAALGGITVNGMIWVRNVKNVRIENLYVEINASSKEAIVAMGTINGLQLVGNYVKVTASTSGVAIGVNVAGTTDSSVPTSEARGAGQFVTIENNVIEPGSSSVPKRAIALQNTVGLIKGNQVAATTQDMWIQSPTASSANPIERTLVFEDNWFFGRLQLYLSSASGLSQPLVIRNNHFIFPSSFSPSSLPGGVGSALGNGSEAHSLRMMSPQGVATVIEGNEFKGFRTTYRALWVMNRADVTIQDNVFTPEPGQSDFTAVLVGNREVWNGSPAPTALGVTILRNTFNVNGAPAGNKAKAILFVDDNDPTGVAPGGSLQIGDGTVANANHFDAAIGWYVALDDRTCSGNNHNGSANGCNGTASYAIGEAIAYSSGSNASSQKRPFKWDVNVAGNSFGGVAMASMTQAQYDAVWAKTFDNHTKVQTAATVGNVVYGWTLPVLTTGTITFSPTSFTFDNTAHTISASLQEDASAICVVTPTTVTAIGDASVSATCTSPGYNVSGAATIHVDKGLGTAQLAQTAFVYTGSAFTLAPSMTQEPGASCIANPATLTNAGSATVAVDCSGTNYDAHASIAVTVDKAVGHAELNPANFDYTNADQTVHARIAEEPATSCAATPASVRAIGSHAIAVAACDGSNYRSVAASLSATVGGGSAVHRTKDNAYFASVAAALADAGTLAGDTLELAPGIYGAITLTKGVHLVGSAGFTPSAGRPATMLAGPTSPPTTIIDGGNAVADGITIANGVTGASISGFEIRNFTNNCVYASGGNHGSTISENVVHGCGVHGIAVADSGGIDDVTIDHNEVYATGLTAGNGRGIVVWDGVKRDITITNNNVHDLSGCCGIELQDGTATGMTVTDNVITNTVDSGMGFVQLTSGSQHDRPNTIARNQISSTGRFGIGLVIPNGSGAASGDGAIVVEGNVIVASASATNPRDRAGIAVIRRSFSPAYPFEVDATRGVIVRNNNVSGFTNANAGYEGYGIVVEGLNSSVSGNTLANNGIGLQIQQGNPDGLPPGDADQNAISEWFGRGNAPATCVSVGEGAEANSISGSALVDQRQVPLGVAMIGHGVTNETTHARYCSINAAIAAATAGDVITVAAGTYAEDVVIDKAVTLKGAKAGVNAGVGSTRDPASGESIIVPANAESGISLSSSGKSVVEISSDNVTLDGFVIDTDNTAINSGVSLNGTDPDVSGGVFANGNGITLANLIVRNAIYAGIDGGYDNQPAQDGNVIRDNRLVNCDGPSFGIGIALEQNFYAKVTGNRMDAVRTGIQLDNNNLAAPSPGYMPEIAGNQIQAKRIGIWANLFYQDASTYHVVGNTITAASGGTGQWNGVWVESMQSAQTIVIQTNTIEGSAAAGRTRVGYLLNNIVSSEAANTAIDGGGVSNVEIGVLATDATRYTGPVNDFIVRNVDFLNLSQGALYVEDTVQTPGSARLTIGSGNTYTNVAHKLVLSGTAPTAAGSADEVFVRSARDFVFGGTVSSAGNPACAANAAAPYCAVANASINAGIAAVSTGGTVNVEDGTFGENVIANKQVALKGAKAAIAGYDASRSGSGETVINPAAGKPLYVTAANASVDGFTFDGAVRAQTVVTNTSAGSNLQFVNNRVTNVFGAAGILIAPNTAQWTIAHNLFKNFANDVTAPIQYGQAVKYLKGIGGQIEDNEFVHVQSNALQVEQNIGAIHVLNNRVDGVAPFYTNTGIQVDSSVNVLVKGNSFTNTQLGMFVSRGNTPGGVTLACNTVTASTTGISALLAMTGAEVPAHIFDNNLSGNGTDIRNDWSANAFVVGSNYYAGAAPTTSGNPALIADALSANPVGDPACGDNTPTQLVTYANSSPQDTPVTTAFGSDLHARVEDALGGAVAGQAVAFTAPASGASAVLDTSRGTANYNGEVISGATANGTAGSYIVRADSDAFHADFALTNTLGSATVTLGNLGQAYTGAPRAVMVTTAPANLATSITYAGSTTVPTAAGSYAVIATITDPNYSGSASGTLNIAKATGTASFDNLGLTYTGATQTVTVHIAEETASACVVTPSSVGPAAGSYPVSASCSGVNYDASGSASATIARASAIVTLSHLTQAQDGSPKSVVVTTTPANLPVSITYAGSATPPSAVGTYAVVATVTDANYIGSASGTLQIVQGASDIALVLNGPVDPVHVGETAQYAATMLATPALHSGATFGYKVTLNKSGGSHALEIGDLATMEVFYQGMWVNALDAFGAIPFASQPDGSLVYIFPQGVPGYDNGFPIEDASWTWNFRFGFADVGTYTTTAQLVDGISHAPISPTVTASLATVVEAALPPTDMHLVLGGPAGDVTLGSPAEYTGTLLANPALHSGEKFFVKVTIGKNGGAMTAADFTSMQIFLGGQWVDGADLGVSFTDDGHGNLVYLFPQSQLPGGFPIEDAQWSWNFRFVYAHTGVYTATAQVIPANQAILANPDVLASAAIATTVVDAPVVTPDMKLLLIGPVDDVQVGSPAAYTGTMLANPDAFTGREFYVRVRLSKNGGADRMTAADLAKMELYLGGWQDATADLSAHFTTDGNDLVYLFPQPNGAFPIADAIWTWHFRFSYASAGLYGAVADVVDAASANPLTAPSLANASVQTNVVPQAAHIALTLQGPVVGTVGEALRYTGTLTADPLPDTGDLFFVHIKLSKNGGLSPMTAADLAKMEVSLDGGASWIARDDLPLVQNGNFLEYDFPQPDLASGFPITSASWSWDFRFTYADAATYRADATVVTADASHVAVSNTATVATVVAAQSPNIALQLNGPVAGIQVGQPAQYVGTLRADPLPDPSQLFFVEVRLSKSSGAMQVSDLSKMELYQGGGWQDATAQLLPAFTQDGNDLVYLFPKPVLDNGFRIDEAVWSWQFRFTYADAAIYTATARVLDAADLSQASAPVTISTEVAPQSPNVALLLNGPVADVQVDVPAAYIGRLTNHGPTLTENAYVKVRVEVDGGTLAAGDVTAEVLLAGSWIEGTLNAVSGGLEVDFPDNAGFPIDAGMDFTHQFRIAYHKPGLFSATATLVGANSGDVYAHSGMYTEVVARSAVTASVLIDPATLHVVYDGQPHAATVTTTPAVQSVTVTYNNSATAPTAAGTYVVIANVVDPVYVGSASAILVIDKAPSTVTINAADLRQNVGATRAVGAVAVPMTAGSSIRMTYDGSVTPPSAAGTYSIVATLLDPNYTGSASAALVVGDGAAVSLSIAGTPAMAPLGANGYTDLVDYFGSVGNSGTPTAQPVHYEITVVRIDDGNATGSPPIAIAADDVLACVYDPSGWANQEPGNHHGCPLDYDSLFLGQGAGSLNGRASATFRYPNLADNDLPLPRLDPAMPLSAKFAFKRGEYQVHARIVGRDGTVYASAMAGTTVPEVLIGYNGATSGQAEDALRSQTLLRNFGGRVDGNVIVKVTLADTANAALAPSDATVYYQQGAAFTALPWTQAGNDLVTYYGPASGFPLAGGYIATTSAKGIFHREGSYTLRYDVLDATTQQVLFAGAQTPVTIGPNLVNFALTDLHQVYNAEPHPVSVAPSNVPHAVIYEALSGATCPATPGGNDTTEPTNAGSYCVYVTATAPYAGTAQGTLVIAKAHAAVSIDSAAAGVVNRGFNGAPQVVTATATPTVATINVTYNGNASAPNAAGSYSLLATISDPNYYGSTTGTLIVSTQGGATIVLSDDDGAMDGTIHRAFTGNAVAPVTATTAPAGVSYAVTYIGDGSTAYPLTATPPTAAGQYHVVATTTDANYAPVSASGTLVIDAGNASITLDAATLAATYDGNAHAVTATTNPTGLAYTVTYNGLLDAPSAARSYVVVATITDPNHVATSATGTLVINAASASITLDLATLSATYDGQLHAATATTNPAGLAYSVTYAGNANPPVNAGSYAVVATITAPGHTGTVSGTLVIAKAVGAMNVGATNFTFDGQPHGTTAVISQEPGNSTACTLTPGAGEYPRTNAGSTPLTVACTGSNYTASGSTTLVVSPKPVTISLTGTGSFPYTGSAYVATATVSGAVSGFAATTTVTYNGVGTAPSAVGSYAVLASLDVASSQNYTATPANGTLIVGNANATVTLGTLTATYDGTPHAVTATTNPAGLTTSVTYNGSSTAPTNAGSYTVVATITQGGYSGSASGTLVIAKAPVTLALSGTGSFPYDGNAHAATASVTGAVAGFPATATVAYNPGGSSAPTAVGSYAVLANLDVASSQNYAANAVSGTIVIGSANTTVTLAGLSQTYDGTPRAVTTTTAPNAGLTTSLTYNGSPTAPTNAGTYTVVATVTQAGYSGSASGTLVVSKAAATVTVSNLAQTYDGTAKSATVTMNPVVTYAVTYDGNAPAPTNAGSYAVLATVTDPNYSGSASGTLVIAKAAAGVAITNTTQIFDGSPKPVTATTTPAGLGVDVLYDGGSAIPSAVGTYAVLGTITDPNHTGTASATLQITAADAPDLAVSITDQRDFAQFGKSLTYTIVVSNVGNTAINGASVSDTLPPELAASGNWTCIAVGTATCSATGSAQLHGTLNVPVGGGVAYMINAMVLNDPAAVTDIIVNTVSISAPGDANPANDSATSSTQAVLFRDGFEAGGDGAQWPAGLLDISTLGSLSGTGVAPLAIAPTQLVAYRITPIAQSRDGAFRVEAMRLSDAVWLRLVARAGTGETFSAWSRLDSTSAMLALGHNADGSPELMLVGTAADLEVRLDQAGPFVLEARQSN